MRLWLAIYRLWGRTYNQVNIHNIIRNIYVYYNIRGILTVFKGPTSPSVQPESVTIIIGNNSINIVNNNLSMMIKIQKI